MRTTEQLNKVAKNSDKRGVVSINDFKFYGRVEL